MATVPVLSDEAAGAEARAKGMTEAQHGELLAVIALAHQTNALATALQVPVDPVFDRASPG
jgi:alkylhydroperoxidase family enzyme